MKKKCQYLDKCIFNQKVIFNVDRQIPRELVQQMYKKTVQCVKDHPDKVSHPNFCETAYISEGEGKKSFTLHTHPDHRADYPSEADIRTTKMLKKDNLCIIMADGKTVCWNKTDNFKEPKETF